MYSINPSRKQREVIYLPIKGHTVVLGAAGSGKTTMALLRGLYLAEAEGKKVLILTFNRALTNYMKKAIGKELSNLQIETFHTFARGYLRYRGFNLENRILDPDIRKRIIGEAMEKMEYFQNRLKKVSNSEKYKNRVCEEIAWMDRMGIKSLDEYVKAERIGRTPLKREVRKFYFELREKYRELRTKYGYQFDWEDIALTVYEEFNKDNSVRRYDHILVDEAQDFSVPMMWSVTKAVPEEGGVTAFLDMAQQIYGIRLSWKSLGLNVRNVWRFEENYRNTKEIVLFAHAVKEHLGLSDEDLVLPSDKRAEGAKPLVIKASSEEQELAFICDQAENLYNAGYSVAILVRRREQEKIFLSQMTKKIPLVRLDRNFSPPISNYVCYGSYHAAKGLEFDAVILPMADKDNLPNHEIKENFWKEDEWRISEARLFYVGITRARERLIISYTGDCTPFLPPNRNLYEWKEI